MVKGGGEDARVELSKWHGAANVKILNNKIKCIMLRIVHICRISGGCRGFRERNGPPAKIRREGG
jgi:hypothetical protein